MAGFNVSALSDFTQEQRAELRSIVLNAPKSFQYLNIYEGVKYSEKLPTLESRAQWQNGDGCVAINPSGTTDFAQVTITVSNVKAEDGWCMADLEKKFTSKYLKPGAKLKGQESIQLMREVVDRWNKNLAIDYEAAVWQSATTNTFDSRFKQFNGMIYTIDNASGVISNQTVAGTAFTSITQSNVITIFNNQWLAVPSAVKNNLDTVTLCGDDVFDTLILALTAANQYHFAPTAGNAAQAREVTLPGTNMKVIAVPGLNNDNHAALPAAYKQRIFTFYKDNLVFGTDNQSDSENYEIWYEQKDDKVYIRVRWRSGCTIYYPQHVVSYKNA